MIQAQRATVRPRVYGHGSDDALLLEDEVARLLQIGAHGLVAVLGFPGSGKTTALEHLAAVLLPNVRLVLHDDLELDAVCKSAPGQLVIYTAVVHRPGDHKAIYLLAPWTKDDAIEHLLTMHRPRCAAVMARLNETDQSVLGGVPELWRLALDRLASDEKLPDARRALHASLEECLGDTDLVERAGSACLNAVLSPNPDFALTVKKLARPGFADNLVRMLRHAPMQTMLAAERIAADLHGDGDCDYLAKRLPRELVRGAAALIANDAPALEHLQRMLAGPTWNHAMSVSLLHAAGVAWSPTPGTAALLGGAYLDGAKWRGVDLTGANLLTTDLNHADLERANLSQANIGWANLSQAHLCAAILHETKAGMANLSHADLSEARAAKANFDGAQMEHAILDGAVLRMASFLETNLSCASFRNADLTGAWLKSVDDELKVALGSEKTGAKLEGADFTDANLAEALLCGLCLRMAIWTGACFKKANLRGCDLEYLTLPDADFSEANLQGALLTGTSMPGAHFNLADLRNTGLADVEWEGVDLRGADLRGASFHMGSTRSGLVGSPIASEGSRTGFYTDDYDEQTFKAPEEIRKANLCGGDLRGANFDDVDFYLVDLRGAIFDAEQETHLRRCGAILETRV